jgi:hypothetical protein
MKRIVIMGTANGMWRLAVTEVVKTILEEAGTALMKKYPNKYSRFKYGSSFLADFETVKDFAEGAPWIPRKDGERVPSWQKQMYHLEYEPFHQNELLTRALYGHRMGLFKKYFGENCWVRELQEEMDIASREEFGIAIARHGSINLCMGRVGLHGLLDTDKKYELDIVDAYGNVERKINRTVREVMMGSKVGGIRLWQVIMRAEKGGWEGY